MTARPDGRHAEALVIFGVNPIHEALRAGRVRDLRVVSQPGARLDAIVREARRVGVPVRMVPRADLDRMADGGVHQGAVATVRAPRPARLDELLESGGDTPLILVLDGVEDPRNLGAILRSADAAGESGVVRQKRHAASLSGAAAKASAGAAAHVRVATVTNIARTLDELKRAGVWTVGLVGDAARRYDEVDLTQPTALVLGSEGRGLRRLVREACDWLVSIPMRGHVGSLNVSVAAGVALFEAVRQRSRGLGDAGGRR